MTTRTRFLWAVAFITAELIVIAERVAVRITPLARQYTGLSAYAAMLSMIAWGFLLIGGMILLRPHRWLAIPGLCIAIAVFFDTGSTW